MSARQPIEDIEASLLAATKSALGASQSHMGRVTRAVLLTLTADNGQQKSVRPGGDAGPSQLRVIRYRDEADSRSGHVGWSPKAAMATC